LGFSLWSGGTDLSLSISKEFLRGKYSEFKSSFNRIPTRQEFLDFAGVHNRELEKVYGSKAYSKLQIECGDEANAFGRDRVPEDVYMRQFGDLAKELGNLPVQADWTQRNLRPSISGLAVRPHFIKWSDMPFRFRDWVIRNKKEGYSQVLDLIGNLSIVEKPAREAIDSDFERIIRGVHRWSPARRRNSEESYKVELRMHLKADGFSVKEEFGESDIDLLVSKKFAIEIKKAPNLSEYDRLFGQVARHLQHGEFVIALLMDVPREDQYRNFLSLVDEYLNRDRKFVEVIKK
jgi:hypothetical protein